MNDPSVDPFMELNSEYNPEILYKILKGRIEVGYKDGNLYVYGREGKGIEGVTYINPPGQSFGESCVHLTSTFLHLDITLHQHLHMLK
jgi:hypothetical protein